MMFWKGHDLVIALILKIIKKYDHVKFEINEIRLQNKIEIFISCH